MPEIISNTSPLQYLHQLGVLDVLPKLLTIVTVPPAVHDELTAGRQLGLNLADFDRLDWIIVRRPSSSAALPLVSDLGAGKGTARSRVRTPDYNLGFRLAAQTRAS